MESAKPKLTARDWELVAIVWQCFDSEPKVNYKKFAELAGLKNSASANATWIAVKKKLTSGGTPAAKVTPKSDKRKKDAIADGCSDNSDEGTPMKKPRTNARAKASAKKVLLADDDNKSAIDSDSKVATSFKGKIYETGEEFDTKIKAEHESDTPGAGDI